MRLTAEHVASETGDIEEYRQILLDDLTMQAAQRRTQFTLEDVRWHTSVNSTTIVYTAQVEVP